ncbi:MAG: hypothetical protein QM784_07390 [Polyangiaceae bacterium]
MNKLRLLGLGLVGLNAIGCVDGSEIDEPVDGETSETTAPVITYSKSIAPGPNGYATLGQGYSSVKQQFANRCFTAPLDPNPPQISESRLAWTKLASRDETTETLGFSASGKARYGMAEANARADMARTIQNVEQSITATFYRSDTVGIKQPMAGQISYIETPGSSSWVTSCGDGVVHQTKVGGQLFFLYQLNFASQSDKRAFEASFGASYGPNELQVAIKSSKQSFSGRATIHIEAFQYGGDTTKLGQVLGGAGSTAAADCSFDNLDACNQMLSAALSYGSYVYPAQLATQPSDLEYIVKDWYTFTGGSAQAPVDVSGNVAWGRQLTQQRFDAEMNVQARLKAMDRLGAVVPQVTRDILAGKRNLSGTWLTTPVASWLSRSQSNVAELLGSARRCYDNLSTIPTQAESDACYYGASMTRMPNYKPFSSAELAKLDVPLQVAGNAYRADFSTEIDVYTGRWGGWSAWKYCAPGQYIVGLKTRVEQGQGGGDDTALNSVQFTCAAWGSVEYSYLNPNDGSWGSWGAEVRCNRGPIVGAELRYETGSHDDQTGANDVHGQCMNGDVLTPGGMGWGNWQGMKYCPAGSAACGARLQIEGNQGGSDDTAMNGLQLACCRF